MMGMTSIVMSSCGVHPENNKIVYVDKQSEVMALPDFDEARISNMQNGIWALKIKTYEVVGSIFLIYGEEGKIILVDKSICILCKFGQN